MLSANTNTNTNAVSAQPATVANSVRSEILMHDRSVLDIEAAAQRIAQFHKCPSDLLIRQALIKQGKSARLVMRL